MPDPVYVLDDLRDESAELDALVRELSDEEWAAPTPAPGWSVAHQIAHLAWTDATALLAATDAESFAREVEKAVAAPESFVDEGAEELVVLPPGELLVRWREGREELQRVLRARPAGERLPWYGPPMSVTSMGTARLMETWAHGLDVADALGVRPEPTARLRHVVHLGVRTRDFAFGVHGLPVPEGEFRVELVGPDGELWVYGDEGAGQCVTGSAYDFCRLVVQRAHRDDLDLRAEGADADRWLDIAQCFAGLPGKGRTPGSARG
ncbi:TIGR03084 family metal-binding protein [Streptomyces cavernicola]|uniref:TIGR03084 family metal-binding protein n=1 Tax=Streptomyces cavernicola TaxID=3043613 RepID=A0ABT6SMQ4_9ACTN|nr:TIGR03084 family metal-binding protein [Streptomyces sp. B-S-A6]MDI3409475.1 TIGR03084 family metal-binding protein [Streptomyces sp. B-S-A6]